MTFISKRHQYFYKIFNTQIGAKLFFVWKRQLHGASRLAIESWNSANPSEKAILNLVAIPQWSVNIFAVIHFLSTNVLSTGVVLDPISFKMQKQVLVTKEYIVNYPETTQSAVAKAKKGTLEPTDLITKVVIVEGGTGAHCFLTASELAEILDMQVGHHTNRTRTEQLHWRKGGTESLMCPTNIDLRTAHVYMFRYSFFSYFFIRFTDITYRTLAHSRTPNWSKCRLANRAYLSS